MSGDPVTSPPEIAAPTFGEASSSIVRFWRAAFRPRPDALNRPTQWAAAAIAGVLTSYTAAAGWPLGPRLALVGGWVVVTIAIAFLDRRLWPWQQVIQDFTVRARRDLGAILGTVNWPSASAWLRDHPDAPVWDRYRVLDFVGQDQAAEALIPSLPETTPRQRFDRAWAELGREIRLGHAANPEELRPLLADLDPAAREEVARDIAWANGLLAASRGERLDRLAAPEVPVAGSAHLLLWWNRYWIARWALFGVVLGSIVSAIALR